MIAGAEVSEATAKARYWDRVVDAWNEQRLGAVWRAHSDAVNTALLARCLPPRLGHVLKTDLFDEAVSEGVYPVLRSRARYVTGIDVSRNTVDAAQARYPLLNGIAADVQHLPFQDGEFDAVVSLSTLDHFDSVENIREALGELRRVLRVGGTLIVTLDNGLNPAVALRNRLPYALLDRLRLVPYQVGATCTPARFAALLGSCRFDVEEISYTVHVPRVFAVFMSRLVEKWGGREIRARFLRLLRMGEQIGRWHTRTLTGYFIAAVGTKV
jgi:SAM-dependent methyltransferase